MVKINYKSDFKINERSETVALEVPFVFSYYVFDNKKYVASFDGNTYVNCERKEDGSLDVIFNSPGFGVGRLKVERKYAVDDKAFVDGVYDIVTVDKTDVFITSGKTFETYVETLVVPPYIKGDKGDPMTWSGMTKEEQAELVQEVTASTQEADLLEKVTGNEKISVSDGSGVPKAITTEQIKNYIEESKESSSLEFVDLGLPSGTLWATCNIGAEKPEDSGLFFAWGETEGYNVSYTEEGGQIVSTTIKDAEGNLTERKFTFADYKWSNGAWNSLTKYNTNSSYGVVDNLSRLLTDDDAAYAVNNTYRIPSVADFEELIQYTTFSKVLIGSKKCGMFTAANGNYVIFPITGTVFDQISSVNSAVYYPTCEINPSHPSTCKAMLISNYSELPLTDFNSRCTGIPVRAVKSKETGGGTYDDTEIKAQIKENADNIAANKADADKKLAELGQKIETYATKSELSQINIEIAQAKNDASIAKNAVATLEGLSNATTAAETLAGQVVQIEENKQNISKLNKELFVDKGTYKKLNLLDLPFISGAYLGVDGEVYSLSGVFANYWRITEYVEVKKEDNITNVALFHNDLVCPIIFYDEEKNIVSKVQTSGADNDKVTFDYLQIPVEAKYMRVCYQKNQDKGFEFTDNSLILSQYLAEKEFAWKSEIKTVKEDLLQIKKFIGFEEISETEEEVTELVNHGITSESKEISYNSDGTMSTYSDWVVSEPILIPSRTKRIYGTVIGYNSSGVVLPGLVYLNSDKEFISAINPTTSGNGSFEQYDIDDNSIPADARYIVLQARGRGNSQNQSGIEVFFTYIKEVGFVNLNERLDKMEKEMSSMPLPLSGMKILCLGDSITKGDYGSEPAGTANNKAENYPFFMEKKYGCTVVNEGRNGGTASSCWGSVVKEVNLDDIDAVVIMFGANGSITDTLSTDVEPYNNYDSYAATQCGSMCKIIEYIYSKKPNISIFVCTPPQAGTKRQAYRDRIIASQSGVKSIAKRYHIPLIDVYEEAGVSDWTQDVLQPIDNLHFGEVGYSRLGTFIGSKILSNLNF